MSESLHQRREGGKRRDWAAAQRPADKPLITIITSTFNAVQDLPWTSSSLWGQTYPYIQWIVADGASSDGTIELLRANEDVIDIWFSESDSGIYDAWNKALGYVSGDWIQFLGAGDELASPDTLASVAQLLAEAHPRYDLVYGRLQYVSENNRAVLEQEGEPWEQMKHKWSMFRPKLPVHPEVFHHASIMKESAVFDTRYKIAGDSHFLMKHIRNKDLLYLPILITRMPLGGVSGTIAAAPVVSRETKRASRELGFKPPLTHVIYETLKLTVKNILLVSVPRPVLFRVADTYRVVTGKKKRWAVKRTR